MVELNDYVNTYLLHEKVEAAEVVQNQLVKRIQDDEGIFSKVKLAYGANLKNVKFNHITNSLKHFFSDRFKVGKSKFSQFISGTGKLSSDEISGGLIFYGKGKCSICHSGPHFSDFDFHTILFPHAGFGKNGFGVDYGRFNVTFNAHDLHKFRTPHYIMSQKQARTGTQAVWAR